MEMYLAGPNPNSTSNSHSLAGRGSRTSKRRLVPCSDNYEIRGKGTEPSATDTISYLPRNEQAPDPCVAAGLVPGRIQGEGGGGGGEASVSHSPLPAHQVGDLEGDGLVRLRGEEQVLERLVRRLGDGASGGRRPWHCQRP